MSETASSAEERNPRSILVKALLLLVSVALVTEGSLIAPALPAIQAHFQRTTDAAPILTRLLFAITPLAIALTSPLSGVVADRVGRRPLLVGSTVLVALAGGIGYFLDSLALLIVARGFLGIGIGGVNVAAAALITDYYRGDQRERLLGLQGAAIGFGGVVLVFVAGFLVEVAWNVPFLVFFLVLLLVPFELQQLWEPEGTDSASAMPEDFGEVRRMVGTLPWRSLALVYAIGFLINVVFYLVIVQGPFYLTELVGASGRQIGIALSVYTLFWGLAALFYGRLKSRLNVYAITALVFGLLGVGYAVVGGARGFLPIVVGLAIAGTGLGLYVPNLIAWISFVTPQHQRGRAIGGLTGLFFLGQFSSPFITQPLAGAYGLAAVFVGAGVLLLALTGVFAFASRGRGVTPESEEPEAA